MIDSNTLLNLFYIKKKNATPFDRNGISQSK